MARKKNVKCRNVKKGVRQCKVGSRTFTLRNRPKS